MKDEQKTETIESLEKNSLVKGAIEEEELPDNSPSREELDATDVLSLKLEMLENARGYPIYFTQEEAEILGAIEDNALTEEDAIQGSLDLDRMNDKGELMSDEEYLKFLESKYG